jgi:hypothetical protein
MDGTIRQMSDGRAPRMGDGAVTLVHHSSDSASEAADEGRETG